MTRTGRVAVLLAVTLGLGSVQAWAAPQEQTGNNVRANAQKKPQKQTKASTGGQAEMTSQQADAEQTAGDTSQQVDATLKQMEQEESKHRTRVARIERILALLSEKGDAKGAERAEKLLGKENMRYEKKMTKMRSKNAKAAQKFSERMSKVDQKGKEKMAGKPVEQSGSAEVQATQGTPKGKTQGEAQTISGGKK